MEPGGSMSHSQGLSRNPYPELIKSITDMLKTIPVADFQRCYQKWEQCLHRCVAAHANYFVRDNINVCKSLKPW